MEDEEEPHSVSYLGRGLSWPVGGEQEAFLLRHFVSTVSHFFDFCDPKRHFARVVPQRARSNGALANAVFALSARHLSRTTTFDAYVADVYYQRCLQQLIPALATSVHDESLLVAAVILRLMEEIDVPLTGADLQNHLLGTHAIAKAQEQRSSSIGVGGGLLRAAHSAALRQDLYIAFATRRPMMLGGLESFTMTNNLRDEAVPTALESSDEIDANWANLAVLNCCNVVQFAFGTDRRDEQQYKRLASANNDWSCHKPPSFEPFYWKEGTLRRPIPDTRLLADWHVMGHVYNLLAKLLLEINKPGRVMEYAAHATDLVVVLRKIIAIALHNPQTPSAHLVASMAISMCGHNLTSQLEVTAMEQILTQTETVHGWPTKAAQKSLFG